MPTYNGHRSRAAWNVALWIGNDLYRMAVEAKRQYGARGGASYLLQFLPEKTPDGYRYTLTSLTEALRGL